MIVSTFSYHKYSYKVFLNTIPHLYKEPCVSYFCLQDSKIIGSDVNADEVSLIWLRDMLSLCMDSCRLLPRLTGALQMAEPWITLLLASSSRKQ